MSRSGLSASSPRRTARLRYAWPTPLLLGVEQRDLADLLQVVPDRVGRGTGLSDLGDGFVGVVGIGEREGAGLLLLLVLELLRSCLRSVSRSCSNSAAFFRSSGLTASVCPAFLAAAFLAGAFFAGARLAAAFWQAQSAWSPSPWRPSWRRLLGRGLALVAAALRAGAFVVVFLAEPFAAPLLAEAFAVGSALAAAFVAVLAGAFFAVAPVWQPLGLSST